MSTQLSILVGIAIGLLVVALLVESIRDPRMYDRAAKEALRGQSVVQVTGNDTTYIDPRTTQP